MVDIADRPRPLKSAGKKVEIFPRDGAILRDMSWWPPPLFLIVLVALFVLLAALAVYLFRVRPATAKAALVVELVAAVVTLVLLVTIYTAAEPVEELPLHALEIELAERDTAVERLWAKLYLRCGSKLDGWCQKFGLPFLGILWLFVIGLLAAEMRRLGASSDGKDAKGPSHRGLLVLLEIVGAVMLFALGGVVAFV